MLSSAANPVLGVSEPSCALFWILDFKNAGHQLVEMVCCRPMGICEAGRNFVLSTLRATCHSSGLGDVHRTGRGSRFRVAPAAAAG